MKLHGPFAIRPGPNPRVICKWCKLNVPVRGTGEDELNYLICTRPSCMQDRPRHESVKYAAEICAQIMIYGAQRDGMALKMEETAK